MSSRVICCEAKEEEKRTHANHSGHGKFYYNGKYYCSVHYPILQVQENLNNGDYSFGNRR